MDIQPENTSNEYKTRNILRLSDRVQVIRLFNAHLTRPSYQSLATIFDCSAKQIKNILLNQKAILREYEMTGQNDTNKTSRDEAAQKRQEKIDFLGKVLHEYLQRVVYYNYSVDEEKVRQKALQIKECIAIENFQPNNGWFDHFKATYGIKAFDRESLHNNVQVTEEKKAQLSAIELIQHVSRKEQRVRKIKIKGIKRKRGRPSRFEKLQWAAETMLESKTLHADDGDDDDDDDGDDDDEDVDRDHDVKYCSDEQDRNGSGDYNLDRGQSILNTLLMRNRPSETTTFHDQVMQEINNPKPKPAIIEMYSQQPVTTTENSKRADSPIPDIDSPQRALKYVKALEEYAMLQDSYRAIGLLTQLEQIFEKKCKKT